MYLGSTKLMNNFEMYVKIQLTDIYENTITFAGVYLTDLHYLSTTMMIHRSTSHFHLVLYPAIGIRTELPNGDPLVLCKKGLSKKYDTFLSMVSTWLWGL